MKLFQALILFLAVCGLARAESTPREIIAKAASAGNASERMALVQSLLGRGDADVPVLMDAWRRDQIFLYEDDAGSVIPVTLTGEADADDARAAVRVDNARPLTDADGKPVLVVGDDWDTAPHDLRLRRAMKAVVDLVDVGSPDLAIRLQAINTTGYSQDPEKLPALLARAEVETEPRAETALREAIALIRLKSEDRTERLAALEELRELHTLASTDFLRNAFREAETSGDKELIAAAAKAMSAVESHRSTVNFIGTLFRGLSLGSILLVVALGLAITFGLMGVINMAHGEMIAVGAYATYIVQNVFASGMALSPFGISIKLPGMETSGWLRESYFLFALPISFLAAAGVGILLERGIVRFLYRRPLESLLATWGVSLVLQQLFRLIFGANNVQVGSPSYLSGNWNINDIILGWNRVFVIGFAGLIVFGTWLVLTRTPLGLLMRAVMQNRQMAACMGVRTQRVNMMTFALGSGLAGLAGAFLSQIGNVGPSLGQNYIVESFMTVVVGGVGNIAGTVFSALGIGLVDQSLQQILLNPVIGKILVLMAIILFLQWRPAGIFSTRSRSLD
ncbi:MAG: urea ABC transporter permease subunit UrtB [Verrucomicrobiota bacterium]